MVAAGGSFLASPLAAAEKLRVGKAVPEAFSFVPLDIGMRKGIFAKNGLEIESIAFAGDARMQQAAAADSIDILLGSGPAMAFIVKGAPIKGVAGMAGPPLLLAIVVRPDGPKTAADLKGKKVSVSTAGSLTYWLVSETSRRQGWGPKGIEIAPMGAMPGQIAALKRGDIDGVIMDIGNAFDLEKRGEGRILVRFTDIKDFHIHVIFATDKLIAGRPAAVRGFLKGWFETIAFMRRQQGGDRGDRQGGDQQGRGDHLARLRRADADVLRRRQIQPEGAGDAREVVRGAAAPAAGARPGEALYRGIPAGEMTGRSMPSSRSISGQQRRSLPASSASTAMLEQSLRRLRAQSTGATKREKFLARPARDRTVAPDRRERA